MKKDLIVDIFLLTEELFKPLLNKWAIYWFILLLVVFARDVSGYFSTQVANEEISFLYDWTVFCESPFSIYKESKKDSIKWSLLISFGLYLSSLSLILADLPDLSLR